MTPTTASKGMPTTSSTIERTGPSIQATNMQLLLALMKDPFKAHPSAAVPGGLRAADVHAVLASLKQISKSERSELLNGGEGPAFHNIIFHLAGGSDAELRPPPRKGEDPKFSANLKRDADRLYGARWVVERARRKGDLERLNEHLGAPYNLALLALDDDARDAAKRRRAAAAVLSMCRLLVGAAIWLNGNGAVGTASYIGKIAGVNDMCSRCE